jgi:hypothetical protein
MLLKFQSVTRLTFFGPSKVPLTPPESPNPCALVKKNARFMSA